LEQRNGRIDRYGQTQEPQIRYLYLAGTFEERLLLRLIAKYEQARAHLEFMPDTLGVTADETAWSTGLVAGFAERQAGLFDDEESAIRTLDRVAEQANAEAYRDLIQEIDKAFDGFDLWSVRHGWLVSQSMHSDATTTPASDRKRRAFCHIDLPDFVAAAIAAETGRVAGGRDVLRLPADWLAGLDGLDGFDREQRVLRITRDAARLHDRRGRSQAFLGRAHPVVRRAIGCVQRRIDAARDHRVSVARLGAGDPCAVLFTFSAEMRSALHMEYQRVIGVLLPSNREAVAMMEPEQWLSFATVELPIAYTWRDLFAGWVPQRQAEAEAVAAEVAQREVSQIVDDHRRRAANESRHIQDWLRRRADDFCGRFVPQTPDLFGAVEGGPAWRLQSDPLERLAAFAVDADNAPARRREASNVVEVFQLRAKERAARMALSPPLVRLIGMLMLVPVR
jgi:hypothetical protein